MARRPAAHLHLATGTSAAPGASAPGAPGSPLFTTPAAARYLTIGTRSLKALVAAGKIPVVQVSARRIAFRVADLDTYIASKVR